MVSIFLLSFGSIFVAELLGDKSLFTVGSLAMRYRFLPLSIGVSLALMAKMLAAVMAGSLLSELPGALVAAVTAAVFFTMALMVWLRKSGETLAECDKPGKWSREMTISFGAIFLSEWGDAGQITAAALVARYQAPLVIWLGATTALAAKSLLALTLGLGLRKRVSVTALRYVSLSLYLVMGVLSALRVEL